MSRNPTLIDDEVEQEDDEPTEQGGDQSSDKLEGGSGDEQGTKGSGSDADSSEEEEGGNEYDVTDNFIAPEGEGHGSAPVRQGLSVRLKPGWQCKGCEALQQLGAMAAGELRLCCLCSARSGRVGPQKQLQPASMHPPAPAAGREWNGEKLAATARNFCCPCI